MIQEIIQHTSQLVKLPTPLFTTSSVSNCGTCPNSTTSLSATCVDFVADGSVCSFALQAVVCGIRFSPISDPVKTEINGTAYDLIVSMLQYITYYILCYIHIINCRGDLIPGAYAPARGRWLICSSLHNYIYIAIYVHVVWILLWLMLNL